MLATQFNVNKLEKPNPKTFVNQQSLPTLTAQWLLVDGELQCRWIKSY